MKKLLFVTVACIMLLTASATPVLAAQPVPFTIERTMIEFVWSGASWGCPFGKWSAVIGVTPTTSNNLSLTGNALHTTFSVCTTDIHGDSTDYVHNKKTDLWIQREGIISYVMPSDFYGLPFPAKSYLRGYLQFKGPPSDDNFVHGVTYQWIYIHKPHYFPMNDYIPYAVWDNGAWLVEFNIQLYDKVGGQLYDIQFPDPFIKPVPASSYNPLGL